MYVFFNPIYPKLLFEYASQCIEWLVRFSSSGHNSSEPGESASPSHERFSKLTLAPHGPVAAALSDQLSRTHTSNPSQATSFSWGDGNLVLIGVSSPTPEGKEGLMTISQ